jgi:hypothetical protein
MGSSTSIIHTPSGTPTKDGINIDQTKGQLVLRQVPGKDCTEVKKFNTNTTTTKSAGFMNKLNSGARTKPPPKPVNERMVPASSTTTHIIKKTGIDGNS